MNILVIGRGFLGSQFAKNGYTVLSRDDWQWPLPAAQSSYPDAESWDELHDIVRRGKYDVIVNCAAKSNTRYCENPSNWENVYRDNVELPRKLEKFCSETDMKFVHISTGCLYDRNDVPQTEDDFIAAHCRYTVSKWCAENSLQSENTLILRPRLLMGDEPHANNLITKLRGFTQFLLEPNSYTHIQTIVEATVALLETNQSGIFNVCEDDQERPLSLYDLAIRLGIADDPMPLSAGELRRDQGIYLVNNIMSIEKLKNAGYSPMSIIDRLDDIKTKLN